MKWKYERGLGNSALKWQSSTLEKSMALTIQINQHYIYEDRHGNFVPEEDQLKG